MKLCRTAIKPFQERELKSHTDFEAKLIHLIIEMNPVIQAESRNLPICGLEMAKFSRQLENNYWTKLSKEMLVVSLRESAERCTMRAGCFIKQRFSETTQSLAQTIMPPKT